MLFSVIEVDEFTGHLWNIYETVRQEGIAQVSFILLFNICFIRPVKATVGLNLQEFNCSCLDLIIFMTPKSQPAALKDYTNVLLIWYAFFELKKLQLVTGEVYW